MPTKFKLLPFLLLIVIHQVKAQDTILDKEIVLNDTTASIEAILSGLSEKSGIDFTYSNQIGTGKEVTIKGGKQTVKSILDQLFTDEVECITGKNRIILSRKTKEGKNFTVSGHISDSTNGEFLIGATVFVQELSDGAATNTYGFYSLTLPSGTYTFLYTFIGYKTIRKQITLSADLKADIELPVSSTQLNEIEITSGGKERNILSKEISTHKLSISNIEAMPAIGGSPDIIKSIQLLPGVTTVGEGSTGFFVRGGGRDQNLILLDEAPVYNPSHLLGLLSVFNTDAIKDITLYKGGIPAQYGGRGSSILDIRMNEGSTKKLNVKAALGPIGGAKLTVDAPIREGKGSFMLSGRRTYFEPFLWVLASAQPTTEGTRLSFYDFNAKVNYTLDDKNKLFLSGYFGRDINRLPILDFDVRWGNRTSTLRWNHLFSDKLFSNLTLIYSGYNYKLDIPAAEIPVGWESGIRDTNIKYDFTLFANPSTTFDLGLNTIHHRFDPGSNDLDPQFDIPDSQALEHGLFLGVEKEVNNSLLMELGVRWSLFQNIGKTTSFRFDADYLPIDTVNYNAGELYNSFSNIEPRFSARYSIDDRQSIKLSYDRMAQYLHMLANSSLSFTAFDVWYPSGLNIAPLIVDQVSIGYFRNFKNNQYEASIEGYYKKIENQIDYKDFAQITFNPLLEAELRTGKGWSYGLEFFLKKKTGKFTGWFSYTWSRAFHQIPEINNNVPFPAMYDQPHKIATTALYPISKKFTLSANWVYNTGGAITLPVEGYDYGGSVIPVPVYNSRNDSRLPDYHRLDLSLKIDPLKNEYRKVKIEGVVSIYNVYSRLNALSIFVGDDFSTSTDETRTVVNKVTLLPIVPSFSLLFKY